MKRKLPEKRYIGEENAPMIKIWSGFLVVKVRGN
jgi:hypothetical protein